MAVPVSICRAGSGNGWRWREIFTAIVRSLSLMSRPVRSMRWQNHESSSDYTDRDGALAGVGLDYLIILTPLSALFFVLAGRGQSDLLIYGVLLALGAVFGAWLFAWARRQPLDTSLPMPPLVRGSFVAFVLALLLVSVRLFLRIPTLPWPLTPELSVIAGSMFLGAAAYFVYGLLRPSWANAGGQLAGFLAYDLVLIGPLLSRLPTIDPEFRTALIIYLVVVVYSGLLAIYYLFVNKETRLRGR